MSRKFKKNNCISDSESDEEYVSSSKSSESEDSLSSISVSENENKSDDEESDSSAEANSVCEESNVSASSPKNSSLASTSSSESPAVNSNSQQSKQKNILKDLNSNQLAKKTNRDSKGDSNNISALDSSLSVVNDSEIIIENSFNDSTTKKAATKNRDSKGDPNDILALDSSLSVVNDSEIIIENSFNESVTRKTPYNNAGSAKSRIIEESPNSKDSFELGSSFPNYSDNSTASLREKHKVNSSVEVECAEELSRTSDSLRNLSKISTQSSNSFSKSGLSNGSQASIHSNSSYDELKALKNQLADKRTTYQNIQRAIKFCDPKKLKDGGKLLKEKLDACKGEIDELKEKLKSMPDAKEDSVEKCSPKPNNLFSTSDQVTANLGKKGLETHRVEAALTVDALVTLHGSLQTCPPEDALEVDPKGLLVELMPHQKYALSWLLWREQQIPPGGILADDMGLGKTLTMIALVLRAEEYKRQRNITEDEAPYIENGVRMYPGKTLVVCPSSLLGQWQNQIEKHCKRHILSTTIHHGKPRELQAKRLAALDIVISSYGVVAEENKIIKGDKKGPLFRVRWERVIIDEGHVIRNHKTKKAQAICELEAKYRWCLTGTPVQNKELDMYSLLKFLRCSPFDSLPVWKRWVDNKSANGIQRLNTVVKSILLRRTKEELQILGELQELPTKTSVPVYINLDEEEQKVYQTVLQFSKSLLAEFIMQEQKKHGFIADEWKSRHHELLRSPNEIKATEIFVLLLRLRQICCLPALIHSLLEKDSCSEDGIDPEDDPILQNLTSQLKRMSVGAPAPVAEEFKKKEKILVESNPVFEISRPSRKIRTVLGIIREAIEANDKIIIVSQWANLLNKLKVHIEPLDIGVATLDGSVPVKLRLGIIDNFNRKDSDVKVLLLSLTAGGVGLNLVGGNRLVIFEPHWNPQLESQACDRIYRVGQKKQVYIYKIICKGTIEEKIELLQKKKLGIANSVLKGELKMNRSKLTLADLKILFDVHS